jgi:hypothetical protein
LCLIAWGGLRRMGSARVRDGARLRLEGVGGSAWRCSISTGGGFMAVQCAVSEFLSVLSTLTLTLAAQPSHVSPILQGPGSTPERRVVASVASTKCVANCVPSSSNWTNPNPYPQACLTLLDASYLHHKTASADPDPIRLMVRVRVRVSSVWRTRNTVSDALSARDRRDYSPFGSRTRTLQNGRHVTWLRG